MPVKGRMNHHKFAWLSLSIALFGCADENSQELDTSEIRVSYYAERETSKPEVVRLRAHPYKGSSLQGVDFKGGDRVEVTTNAMSKPLVLERGPIGGYFGDLPAGDHREVTFSLVRSEKASAPASKVTTMPALAFETDPEGTTVSYASEGLVLRWANGTAGAKFELQSATPCDSASVSGTTEDLPDNPTWDDAGSLTIAPAQLSATPPPQGGACILVRLRHALSGKVDPALESRSVVEAIQDVSFEITLVP